MRLSKQERHLDHLVIHASGLALEQTASFLGRNAPSFAEFEHWIVATTGGVEPARVARINPAVSGSEYPDEIRHSLAAIKTSEPVLSEHDLASGVSMATSCCTMPFRPRAAMPPRRRYGTISARASTIPKRGAAAAITASWCSISSTRPSRPIAAHRAFTRPSHNCEARLICGSRPTASASRCRSAPAGNFPRPTCTGT